MSFKLIDQIDLFPDPKSITIRNSQTIHRHSEFLEFLPINSKTTLEHQTMTGSIVTRAITISLKLDFKVIG